MSLEQPAVDVRREVVEGLGEVVVESEVEVGVVGLIVGRGGARDAVEEIGEPQEGIFVADDPVEVNAPLLVQIVSLPTPIFRC